MAAVSSVTQPSDPYLNAVVGNTRWQSGSISYSFMLTSALYEVPYGPSNEPLNNFGALNATQQSAARAALANFAQVASVSFSELTGTQAPNATIRMGLSDAPSTAWAYLPSTSHLGGDAWFNKSSGQYNNPVLGNYAYATFAHELGHAMGLTHPHENSMPADRDSLEFSIMTYRAYVGASTSTGYPNETWGFPQTLMMYDIAALQYMYGANFNTNSGNTTYSWSPTTGQMFINGVGQATPGGNVIFMTLWDGGGTDIYDFSNYATNLTVDLRPGEWTTTSTDQRALLHFNGSQVARGNIANALQFNGDVRSLIENAIGGSGNDTLIGNAANNVLRGGRGNDSLDGLGGSDTMAFSGTFAQYTFTVVNNGVQVADLVTNRDGTDIGYNFEFLQFSDRTVSVATAIGGNFSLVSSWSVAPYTIGAIHHFDSDGDDDIIWRNPNGDVALWRMQNNQPATAAVLATGISGWILLIVADINGDGDGDLIWHNTVTGAVATWNMQNGAMTSSTQLAPTLTGWTVVGAGDIDGDGDDDILWQNTSTNQVASWDIQGGTVAGSRIISPNVAGWTALGMGDLNGDGDDDVVWLNTSTTQIATWNMQNGNMVGSTVVAPNTSGWTFSALGDFDGDGDEDIVWKSSSGVIAAWEIQNGAPIGSVVISQTGSNWMIRGTGDFNADGIDELVVASADGQTVQTWMIDDPAFAAAPPAPQGAADGEPNAIENFAAWVGGDPLTTDSDNYLV